MSILPVKLKGLNAFHELMIRTENVSQVELTKIIMILMQIQNLEILAVCNQILCTCTIFNGTCLTQACSVIIHTLHKIIEF